MMIVAGCDVGSTTGKAVILKDGEIVSSSIVLCKPRPEETARIAINEAMERFGISSLEELDYIVGTGYGRLKISFAHDNFSEIACHGMGAFSNCNSVRTIIDIGGQDLKVIGVGETGTVTDFAMNDKCAAGTGKFLENMAKVLGLDLETLSTISLNGTRAVAISAQCSVFAESEVITLLNEGEDITNIALGLHNSIASRLLTLINRVGAKEDITIAGGCAKNTGLIDALEKRLDTELVRLSEDPQIMGAYGAALFAEKKLSQQRREG